MSHRRFTHLFRRRVSAARIAAAVVACGLARPLRAQETPAPSAQLPAYRTPVLEIAQPPSGGAVPQDKPIVVFRFAQGEPDDQLDLRSLSVTVDGRDVTSGFQVGGSEAWGSLSLRDNPAAIAIGVHDVSAQICSTRGACAIARAMVTVLPPLVGGPPQSSTNAPATTSLKRRILDAALNATRRLLTL